MHSPRFLNTTARIRVRCRMQDMLSKNAVPNPGRHTLRSCASHDSLHTADDSSRAQSDIHCRPTSRRSGDTNQPTSAIHYTDTGEQSRVQ